MKCAFVLNFGATVLCSSVQVVKQKGKEKYNVITIKFEIYLITLIIIVTIYHHINIS